MANILLPKIKSEAREGLSLEPSKGDVGHIQHLGSVTRGCSAQDSDVMMPHYIVTSLLGSPGGRGGGSHTYSRRK